MRTQRERTIRNMNLHICATWECDDDGWPVIRPSHAVPERLATFQVSNAKDNSDAFAHFFIDDYRFERLWTKPERYVPVLRQYAGMVAPDFSTYMDMPYPMQQWNVYRSRVLTQYYRDQGIEVIPTLNWSDERSLDFSLKGVPEGGTCAVCTTGCLSAEDMREDFIEKLSIAIERVRPETLLLYGKERDLGIPPNIQVVWYSNDNHDRVVGNAGHRDRKRV